MKDDPEDEIVVNDDNLLAESNNLSEEDRHKLACPPGISDFQRDQLERDAKKNWDLFYKRNGDRFFKRRYWTRREFYELLNGDEQQQQQQQQQQGKSNELRYLFEVGCGCGDFALPLLYNQPTDCDHEHEGIASQVKLPSDLFIYCCDISDKAIEILRSNDIYKRLESERIKAFVANITAPSADELLANLDGNLMDFMSLVFVLSALDPGKMQLALQNLSTSLKPGGLVFFRDYAIYDKAMLRFSERSKIQEQFYVRQDGTRAYFFTKQQLVDLFAGAGFQCETIEYVKRETINKATKNTHSRIFLQAKFRKPTSFASL